MIKKYVKKPVVISAVEWTGDNIEEIRNFCGDAADIEYHDAAWKVGKAPVYADLSLITLEGKMHASIGDYIIRGVQGEFYACKPDIFERTYEETHDD